MGDLFSQTRSLARYRFENNSPKNFVAHDRNNNVKNSSSLTVHSSLNNETNFSRFTSHFSLPQPLAFTLAEVLITLGIIGIIAAMTFPIMITKYQKQVTVERLKKFYSVMQNAIRLSEYDNGEMADWDFPKDTYDRNMKTFFDRYYRPYLKDSQECSKSLCFKHEKYDIYYLNGKSAVGIYSDNYIVKLNDGMYVYFLPNTPAGYIWMFVDINGHQKPNTIGRDIFVFDIYGYPARTQRKNYHMKFWGEYDKDDENLTDSVGYGCNKSAAQYSGFKCGELILRSGWKIPKNYPW